MIVAYACIRTSIIYKCSKFVFCARNARNVKSQQASSLDGNVIAVDMTYPLFNIEIYYGSPNDLLVNYGGNRSLNIQSRLKYERRNLD